MQVFDSPEVHNAIATFLGPDRPGAILEIRSDGTCLVTLTDGRVVRVNGSGHALPFRDACVHRLLCIDALNDMKDPERFLVDARRLLAPGGGLLTIAVEPPPRAIRGHLVKADFSWSESYEVEALEDVSSDGEVVERRVFATSGWLV